MYAEVSRVERLTPTLIRIEFTGGTLGDFEGTSATDGYVNARFIPVDSPLTVPFSSDDVEGLASEHRPRPRRFTIRRWDRDTRTLTIDFVAHGDDGHAGAWAQRARPGDRLQFDGPGGSFRPATDVEWHLLVGDESALGAIAATLDALGPDERALAIVVVDGSDHEIELESPAALDVVWVHRDVATDPETALADAVVSAVFPAGSHDVFVHGEAGEVRAIRRHLMVDRGIDASTASISPYWRRRHTDEAWRSVKKQWMADVAADA